MADFIVILVIAAIIAAAAIYIYKSKKKGVKCIGCSVEGGCPSAKAGQNATCSGCSCGCGNETEC